MWEYSICCFYIKKSEKYTIRRETDDDDPPVNMVELKEVDTLSSQVLLLNSGMFLPCSGSDSRLNAGVGRSWRWISGLDFRRAFSATRPGIRLLVMTASASTPDAFGRLFQDSCLKEEEKLPRKEPCGVALRLDEQLVSSELGTSLPAFESG